MSLEILDELRKRLRERECRPTREHVMHIMIDIRFMINSDFNQTRILTYRCTPIRASNVDLYVAGGGVI